MKAVYGDNISECSYEVYATVEFVSINTISNTLKRYPNPTSGKLNIDFSENETFITEITDLTGKIISSKSGYNSNLIYNLSSLAGGIYLINIKTEKKNFTKKIIIK